LSFFQLGWPFRDLWSGEPRPSRQPQPPQATSFFVTQPSDFRTSSYPIFENTRTLLRRQQQTATSSSWIKAQATNSRSGVTPASSIACSLAPPSPHHHHQACCEISDCTSQASPLLLPYCLTTKKLGRSSQDVTRALLWLLAHMRDRYFDPDSGHARMVRAKRKSQIAN
jgi:hypothetical protein